MLVPGTKLKLTGLITPGAPLNKKDVSPPVGTKRFTAKNSFVDRTNATVLEPVQTIGGNIASPTSQPKPD